MGQFPKTNFVFTSLRGDISLHGNRDRKVLEDLVKGCIADYVGVTNPFCEGACRLSIDWIGAKLKTLNE